MMCKSIKVFRVLGLHIHSSIVLSNMTSNASGSSTRSTNGAKTGKTWEGVPVASPTTRYEMPFTWREAVSRPRKLPATSARHAQRSTHGHELSPSSGSMRSALRARRMRHVKDMPHKRSKFGARRNTTT